MSHRLEISFLGASKMSAFANLPEPMRDRAIAQFLRSRRPDLYDLNFLGDFLTWSLGTPNPAFTETRSTANAVDLRMSGHLLQAVRKITMAMDYTSTPDPLWSAVLRLRASNENSFDFSNLSDGLAFFLASLELQIAPD